MTKITQQAFPWGQEEELTLPSVRMAVEILVNGKWEKASVPRNIKTFKGLKSFCEKLLWNKGVDAARFETPEGERFGNQKEFIELTKADIPFKEAQKTMPAKSNFSGLWGLGLSNK